MPRPLDAMKDLLSTLVSDANWCRNAAANSAKDQGQREAGATQAFLTSPPLNRRLALRPDDEWGGPASDGAANARIQHAKKDDVPVNAIIIDATAPITNNISFGGINKLDFQFNRKQNKLIKTITNPN